MILHIRLALLYQAIGEFLREGVFLYIVVVDDAFSLFGLPAHTVVELKESERTVAGVEEVFAPEELIVFHAQLSQKRSRDVGISADLVVGGAAKRVVQRLTADEKRNLMIFK